MASSELANFKATGVLYKRQRGQNTSNLKGLKWQRRRIRLTPTAVEYYGVTSTVPNGQFPVGRIKIVEKIPEGTFRKKYCFQVGDETEVIYFKAKTDDKRTKWMQEFRQIAIDNGNELSEYYHTGAYGLLSNPTRWSCCMEEKREAKGCEKMIICSVTLPRGSMPDTMVFSEEELSDNEETDPVIELSHESAPDPLLVDSEQRMRQLDTCPIPEEYYEPDPPRPRPHMMVKRSSSDSVKELHVIHEETNLYQSDMSLDSGFGDGKQGSQANISANVSRSSSQIVRRRTASNTRRSQEKGCQTDDEDLVSTISSGDIQSLRTIIEQGLDPNMDLWVGCHKTTLLSLACEYGQERLVNMIISEHTELRIDCQDESGKTPLMVAAKKGLKSVVDILIERGADVDIQSFDGRTALHEAAEGGHLEIVRNLLQNKANPLVHSGEHRPHDLAASHGHREVAEALQDKMPKKFVPYTLLGKSIHLNSKVGSLRYIGYGTIVALTESEVSLIDAKSQSIHVEKVANVSAAGLDLWKDTLILGSECVQFIDVKNTKRRLSHDDSQNAYGKHLVAVAPNGKMVSSLLRGTTIQVWKPDDANACPFQSNSSSVTGFTPHKEIEMNCSVDTEIYCLSISAERNAPYIAVGVKKHSEYEVLIYNYEKNVNQPPNPIIFLGKSEQKGVAALAPDGSIIVSGMDQKLEIFSVTACPGKKLQSYSNFGNGTYISSICFPPEGTHEHILVGLSTGDIKVFSHDLNEGPVFTLQEPNSEPLGAHVTALTYSRDAHFLASGHHNGLVHIWKTPIGRKSHKSSTFETHKFVVDKEGWTYTSKKDGYSFVILSDVLSKELTITHGIIPFGKVACYFPEHTVPISNILQIQPDQKCSSIFMVKMSFQHCLNMDPTDPEILKDIVLLKAHHRDNVDENSQLNFEIVKDAKIYPGQNLHELTAQVGHCCAYCLGKYEISEKETSLAIRFYLVEIKPKNITESRWNVEYCLSYIFDSCQMGFECEYPKEKYIVTRYTIEFSPTQDGTEPCIELNIAEPEKLGWRVGIHGSKQITKRSVNFWDYSPNFNELLRLHQAREFPPRIKLEIDASRARGDTSIKLSFQGAIAYPGKENLSVTLQLTAPNTNPVRVPNGLVSPPPRPVYTDTTHLKVLRRRHAELIRVIESLQKFTTLLTEVYTKEIIDCSTYEKFLMKLESNPACQPAVLSGFLLLDIHKQLEGKAFLSFCDCVKIVDRDCAKKLRVDYQPPEEAHSQEVPDHPDDDSPCGHGENPLAIGFGGEENTGLQPPVKPF